MDLSDFTVTEESKKFLEREFRKRDVDNSGTIDANELEQCLQFVGCVHTKKDIDFLLKHFDKSGENRLEISDLVDNINIIYAHSVQGDDLMDAFKKLDPKDTGYIRVALLRKVLTYNGNMSDDEADKYIQHIVDTYDTNHDGQFDYAEFVQLMMCEADALEKAREKKKDVDVDKALKKKSSSFYTLD